MLTFEFKKFIKSKKFFFLLLFSLMMSLYGFFFSKGPDLILDEYDYDQGQYWTVDHFFSGEPAPKELIDLENEWQSELYANITQEPSKEESRELEYKDNQMMLSTLEEYKDKYPQPFSEENLDNIANLKWAIFKHEDLKKNNAWDVYSKEDIKGDNLVQRIIFSSKIIFGIVPILFFVLLFSNLFSKEREDQTLNLLYSQPSSRKSIVFAKFLVMAFSILFYVVIALLMYLIFAFILKIPIDGGLDLYRILSQEDYQAYYRGYKLLAYSVIAFFSMGLFWSSLSLFFSTRFNSQKVFSIMLVVIAIIYASTPYLPFIRNVFNPIYNLDIVHCLLGNFELLTSESGKTSFALIENVSLIYYLLFLGLSLMILLVSLFPHSEVSHLQSKEQTRVFSNLFQFESIKIFNTNSYKVYLLGCVFLILTNFAVNLNLNQKVKIETFGDSGMFKATYLSTIDFLNREIKRQENILEGKDKLSYYKVSEDAIVTKDVLDENDRAMVEGQIQNYQLEIDSMASILSEVDQLNTSYNNNDGKNFYPILGRLLSDRFEMIQTGDMYNLSASRRLSNEMFSQASKDNVAPLVIVAPFFSPLDQYKDLKTNMEQTRDINIYNHSGPMYLFNLFWHKNLATILVVLAAVMVISGFTTDTENGKQIQLMYTSSYTRSKIFYTKILSQFLYSCLTILSIILLIFVLGFIADGLDGYNLPIANYLDKDFELIPLWRYLIRVIGAVMTFVFLLTCLMNTLSIFIKNKLSLLGTTLLCLFIAKYVTELLPDTLRLYSLTSYLKFDMLADQSIKIFENLPNANYLLGLSVFAIWSIVFLVLGRIALSIKKDIQ